MTPDIRNAIDALHAVTPDEEAEVRASMADSPAAETGVEPAATPEGRVQPPVAEERA
jgi:hypothetical protein